MPNIDVKEFTNESGISPFYKWLSKVRDSRAKAKVLTRIKRIQLGNFGDFKSVGGGVQELRIDYGPGYRVYFGRDGDTVVILLCGGTKTTQDSDIETAQILGLV